MMYHKFNNLRTVNSYGEFVWQICRRKGHPVAVISRNGRHYYNLKLMPGFGSRSMHDDVTEFVMDVLCTEAGRMEDGRARRLLGWCWDWLRLRWKRC
nr:MAG TPA: hypothetical protein [Caudoviricetes sp.]